MPHAFSGNVQYKNRLEGYKKTLIKNKTESNPSLAVEFNLMKYNGFEIRENILKEHPDIDGIFSANDEAAVGAIKYLKSMGKKVPGDIAVVGFSNDPLSEVVEPSLTTIDQCG